MTNVTFLVHSRLDLTKQTFTSLENSTPYQDVKVVVYGDAPKLEVADYCRDWCRTKGAGWFMDVRPIGTGAARNKVIKLAETIGRGDYLYLSDSDVFFQPHWLRDLIDCYESAWSNGCRVIGGVGHPYHQHGASLGIHSANVYYGVREVLAQPLQSMLMRWEVWDEFGPFKETPPGRVCMGEDVDFSQAITKAGYKLGVVSPALLVNCGITNSFGEKIPGWEMVQKECPAGVICK